MAGKRLGIPGLSFSWKRAVSITSAKQKLARMNGSATTRAGRQRKVGRALGCCLPLLAFVALALLVALLVWTG